MELKIAVELPKHLLPITHANRLMIMGSCFAQNIGTLLQDNKFRINVNPYGTLYNPYSIAAALQEILTNKQYGESDLFYYRDCWHSPMHHGSFSSPILEETLRLINQRLLSAQKEIVYLDWLLLTFGTAYVYEQRSTGHIVSNCHKQPEAEFSRRMLSVEEIVETYTVLFNDLRDKNPKFKIICTVSPIRHIRDGMHANQVSKSTLFLAIDRLQNLFPDFVFYFPAYEIVTDELRDYRFYNEDMVHPSPLAIRYLWERFGDAFFSDETKNIMEECESIRKAMQHRPAHPDSEEHKRFLGQIVLKIERLYNKYPYLELEF